MELPRLFDELTRAAERAGVVVRSEIFDPNLSDVKRPRGGLCTLRGRRIILIDAKLPLPERIATLAEALAAVDLEGIFMPPVVRATIGAYAPPSAALPVTMEGSHAMQSGAPHRAPPARDEPRPKPALRLVRGGR